ncbi:MULTISPECIES: DUF1815 family protein [Laspinema]|uniref:DUF1815 family protein n=2 Tax=Laspinema TaxID=2584823 RepID=A0ABT2MXT8_9CYAN|nr:MULTISPECIES: DUF1815 family protein [unclassified Laspinema]MCT7954985.1 DUF1815 family protein [Laspinema sp. D2c]MCT7962683.1 DUF1815 family protein [Laspinema sp. D2b]MCT7969347.1 DUF1815 family protein [Laspinema sp. D2a]MCT7970767.1 DUF1815 family protein [Laspinema sp. D3d]MCT7978075.1 DUF1815 family protein [Laspinema sp. D3b]
MFIRLAEQHRQFVKDLVMNLQALAIVLERRGYLASCYTCGGQMNSASFMVSLGEDHLIRFLVSDYGITWTEMRDDRELMKLEGAEAIAQLQELANLVKCQMKAIPDQPDLAVEDVNEQLV